MHDAGVNQPTTCANHTPAAPPPHKKTRTSLFGHYASSPPAELDDRQHERRLCQYSGTINCVSYGSTLTCQHYCVFLKLFCCSFMFLLFYSSPIHVIKSHMSTYNKRRWWWWWWWCQRKEYKTNVWTCSVRPASSAPIERVFSESGLLVRPIEHACLIYCLRGWSS